MEKISKEELLKTLGGNILSDEDLEKVTGGNTGNQKQCLDENNCIGIEEWPLKKACIMHCLNQ